MIQKTYRLRRAAHFKQNKEIIMDAKVLKLFVDDLELFTKCKDKKERGEIEHFVSYIIGHSVNHFTIEETEKVVMAIYLSAKHHEHARRASGESYIIHPLRVAYKFMRMGFYDFKLTVAAILHDAIEDKTNKRERRSASREIIQYFGEEILVLVLLVTKKFFLTKSEDLANRNDYYLALTNSNEWRAKLLKVVDRNDNIETLSEMPLENQKRKIAETHRYFPKICDTLLVQLKKELVDHEQEFRFLMAKRIIIHFESNLNNYVPK